jgi:lipopolysaccharide transport system permease protein
MVRTHALSANAPDAATEVMVVEPSRGWRAFDFRELWRYRELIYFLAWRDVKVRYKQAALGVAWALLQPVLAMAIFSILGSLANLASEGVPYPLFAYTGLLPWLYFANATSNASGSLVSNANLISKVYFPRLVIPLAGVLAGLVDLGVGLLLLLVLLVPFGITPSLGLLLVPLLVLLAMLTALSVSIWLSALDVQYRDVRYAVPFLIQVWMFATPVLYSPQLIPERYRTLLGLNPMTGVVEGFRWAILGRAEGPGPLLAVSIAVTLLVLVTGLFYFYRMERSFADIV